MAKFYNEDYEETVAFSQEELDEKVKEAVEAKEAESKTSIEEAEANLEKITKEKDDISKRYDSRKDEYDNLKKKMEETDGKFEGSEKEKTEAFEKMRDDMIKKVAGDDKEYAEELTKAVERLGEETLDPTVLETTLKESHALAMTKLEREYTPLDLSKGAIGDAPRVKEKGKEVFLDTESGKATLDHVLTSMGQDVQKEEGKNDKK